MVRWILLVVSLASLILMFFGHTTGWVTFGVIGFLLGSVGTTLAFAQARIVGSERLENLQLYEQPPTPVSPANPAAGSEPAADD